MTEGARLATSQGSRAIRVAADLPLRRHVLFESSDRDETRRRVSQVFCPHELCVLQAKGRLDARQHFASLGRVAVSYLSYGTAVDIRPQDDRTFYLVQVPLCGAAIIRAGRSEFTSSPRVASVINPSDALRMRWSGDCGQLILRFESAFVEAMIASYLGYAMQHRLRFHDELDCATERSRRWLQLVRYVIAQLESDPAGAPGPLAKRQLEQALLALLLEAQPSDHSERLEQPRDGCAPRHVRRAAEFMTAHAAEPIGMEDIVAASGASMRSLYEGFRRFRGTSPMEFLRSLRLRHAHEDLNRATAGTTVSGVATRWGFYQFGRFAARYRQLYGESPSVTLRRALSARD